MFNNLENTLFLGKCVTYLPTCHSTNDFAKDLVKKEEDTNGQIIITLNQTNGRGQRGNKWLSEPGVNLTFSIVLDSTALSIDHIFILNILVSLGILEGLINVEPIIEPSLKIKWPNDIFFNNQKMGGILIENILNNHLHKYSIIGIGLNVNQINFNYLNAISLKSIFNKDYFLPFVLEVIIQQVEMRIKSLGSLDYESLKEEYLSHLYRHRILSFFKSNVVFEGQIVDVDKIGRLGVETDGEILYYSNKEIQYVNSGLEAL